MFMRGKLIKFGTNFGAFAVQEGKFLTSLHTSKKDTDQLIEPLGIRVVNKLTQSAITR